jgi:hypothetical protein
MYEYVINSDEIPSYVNGAVSSVHTSGIDQAPPNAAEREGPVGQYELCWGLNFGLNSVLLKEGSILDRSGFANNYKVPHMTKLRRLGGLICYLRR